MKKITIPSQEGFEIIDTENIILLEAEGSYTKFYLKNNIEFLSSNGIGEYDDMLDANNFMRIHKSYIVNVNEIRKYIKGDGGSVILSNNKEAFVSKRKKEDLIAIFKKVKCIHIPLLPHTPSPIDQPHNQTQKQRN